MREHVGGSSNSAQAIGQPTPVAITLSVFLRSLVFALGLVLITPPYSLIALASFPLPRLVRYRIISGWTRIVLAMAEHICGLRYRVEGLENFPKSPAVILSKHQSAWETLAFQVIFPPQVLVLKRELLWIPCFGWGLALMSPIAIDRSRGRKALARMAELGAARMAQGFCITLFPEGTRIAPGQRGTYHAGGAWLAARTGAPIVPVAHNAGLYWAKNAFIKHPGLITVAIGKPIPTAGRKADDLIREVEDWIETRMTTLSRAA
jgi:1-acyl-sn-glycerol-3-phosphate acyltransferase